MYIKINDNVIENADWRVDGSTGELRFETNEGVSAVQDVYMPDTEVKIEEYNDDDTLKAQWFMRKLISVTYKQNEDTLIWEVQAKFEMSANPITEIENIRSDAEDTDDGIFELAAMIDTINSTCDEHGSKIREIDGRIPRIESLINSLMDRVATLENKG